jgi:hypothetical protein
MVKSRIRSRWSLVNGSAVMLLMRMTGRVYNERGRQLRRPYVVGGSMSGARGVGSGPALDSSIWDRRSEAFSIRAAASSGSCVARANSTSVAAWRMKYCLPITIFSPFDYAAQNFESRDFRSGETV